MSTSSVQTESKGEPRRRVAPATSLDELVGAHPDALDRIYRSGTAADPADLGAEPTGRLLAITPAANAHLALRPLIRAIAHGPMPWRGKVFDHGGNSGQNVIFGKRMFRFHAEGGASLLDGRPTLVLRYDHAAYNNPWPTTRIVDELRTVGPGIAIGPAYYLGSGSPSLVLWFGLGR
jgi:hypothetical protein